MKRIVCVSVVCALLAAPALAQVPAVKRASVRLGQAVLAQLDQEYTDYDAALDAEKAAVAAEAQAYSDLQAADAALQQAQAARDAAQADYDSAKLATDGAHQTTEAAYQAVRP